MRERPLWTAADYEELNLKIPLGNALSNTAYFFRDAPPCAFETPRPREAIGSQGAKRSPHCMMDCKMTSTRTAMNTPEFTPHPNKAGPQSCVSIVGMAAAGKTTVGRELAALIGWPQIDTDNVIEAAYGMRLQRITDKLDKEGFLDLEGEIISRLNVRRCIISTGGSAVYRDFAIQHLKSLGPIVYISVPLPIILERFARKPERGMAMNPGQTIEDLYAERSRLYDAAADFTLEGGPAPASEYARGIAKWLAADV